jgi:hypothetical protein
MLTLVFESLTLRSRRQLGTVSLNLYRAEKLVEFIADWFKAMLTVSDSVPTISTLGA